MLPGVVAGPDGWIARKLEQIHKKLESLADQGTAKGFLNNSETAVKLEGLVEDIHDAIVEYQVCVETLICTSDNAHLRPLCSKISIARVAGRS